MTDKVRAVRTLDCAHKLRVRYLLPEPLDARLLGCLGPGEVRVQDFSARVDGARDLLTLLDPQRRLRASGADGGPLLTVTYGKLGQGAHEAAHEAVVAEFEGKLADALGVSVQAA